MIDNNTYPGRGIILGQSDDGKSAVLAYFIMGRSENSRNRIFEEGGDGLKICIYNQEKLKDASLIMYTPLRVLGNNVIITNGDQTDTVYELMQRGCTFEEALYSRYFEPDAPNFTPRISGVVTFSDGGFEYKLSILKAGDTRGDTCIRNTFAYEPIPGEGRLIHTYAGDGSPLPSFLGEPERINTKGCIDGFSKRIWETLDRDNRVALYVRFMDVQDPAKYHTRVFNKYKGD